VDEVYLECMYEKAHPAFHIADNIVCTSSLTKAYGLGGLRCGWILAGPDLSRRMWQIKDLIDPSAVHPAELLSVIAFRRLDTLAGRAKVILETNRSSLREFVESCPQVELSMPDYGTCVFPRMRIRNPDQFCDLLHDAYDTDVVPGRFFEMPDHIRIGIGADRRVLKEGLQRLRTALERREIE